MSLGILGQVSKTPPLFTMRSFRGYSGTPALFALPSYGALGAVVPANCWDKPGFKECNARAWQVAEDRCIRQGLANQAYGGDWVKCKEVQASDYAYYGCALRICPPPVKPAPKTVGGWTWASPTPNPSITAFQNHINACLDRTGFKRIGADGRIGPATCGAFKTVGGECPDLFATDPVANIAVCQSYVNPTKLGASSPVKDPVSDEARKLDQQFGGLPWMQPDSRVPTLQQGLNQQLEGHEYFPIAVSGRLDAAMCGGMRFLDDNTGSQWMPTWGKNCQAFTDPRRKPTAKPAGPVGPVAPTGPVGPVAPLVPPGPGPAPAPAKSSNAMLIAGGVLAAALVGGYAWLQSKSGGA